MLTNLLGIDNDKVIPSLPNIIKESDCKHKNKIMDIDRIVNEAIPQDSCPRKEAAAKQRRKILKERIEKIIEPRDKTQPFKPDLEYKGSDSKLLEVNPIIIGGELLTIKRKQP